MSNPVLDKLETQWAQQSRTPTGYPSMLGYQPDAYPNAGGAQWTSGTVQETQRTVGTIPYGTPYGEPNVQALQYPGGPLEEAYRAPAADAVDRGVMTYDDVIMKMAISMGVLSASTFVSQSVLAVNAFLGAILSLVGFIGGSVLTMTDTFSKKIRSVLVPIYAGFEGLVLGAVSQVFELIYPGVVVQTLIATAIAFDITFALLASGKARNSSKFMRLTLTTLVSILVYCLPSIVLTLTGVLSSGGLDSITIMDTPLSTAVGLIAVSVGASCFIQDFGQTGTGVERGVPAKYAWVCAFGILVTVVWMYLEVLRFIVRLHSN